MVHSSESELGGYLAAVSFSIPKHPILLHGFLFG